MEVVVVVYFSSFSECETKVVKRKQETTLLPCFCISFALQPFDVTYIRHSA